MVTFVSQCQKNSLQKTRRVLDAFASRIGNNTWQTVITSEGLAAVKKLLRKTASKNTAVSCHWIRSRSRSELVWVVGNKRKFDFQGIVPVNTTEKEITNGYTTKQAGKKYDVRQYTFTAVGSSFVCCGLCGTNVT
ncbi:MAG: DEAD/DEAH box helicase [Osedax symbiont Rs1]|nr:MAG: DEAD/DEAH box helicase [Osedax symbiont Rs1]